jgi:hypothetical protein
MDVQFSDYNIFNFVIVGSGGCVTIKFVKHGIWCYIFKLGVGFSLQNEVKYLRPDNEGDIFM